ncbi:MAG: hypothetical protein CMA64_10985 [Euryarchaeota archaeon]|nr:hypothetical protein [Euryarchaeota archaeon]
MGILSGIKLLLVLGLLSGIGAGYVHVKSLKADLATSEANNMKLEQSVEDQKAVITQQKNDFANILEANKNLQALNNTLKKEYQDLDTRFNKINSSGKKRDIGNLAVSKPGLIEKIINKAGDNAIRCVEIAMGSPLTEKEKNATKKSQINPECPSIANPNYVPYQ